MPTPEESDLTQYLENIAPRGRTMLLPALHHAQAVYGWLPREVQEEIGRVLRVPLAEVHGVIEFYTMFYNTPTAQRVVRLCEDPACTLAGSDALAQGLENSLGLSPGQTSADGQVTLEFVPCLGMCEHAPAALNGDKPAGDLALERIPAFLDGKIEAPQPKIFGEPRWLTRLIGVVNPRSLESYEAHDGYTGLRITVGMTPEEVLDTIESSGIVGRGGAMFPLGQKLRFTRGSPGDPSHKHIVVNADESEPGTFKDRPFLEDDPFSVIEAATLAAYAVGAQNGWIFIRGEYPRAYARMENAIQQARAAGRLGANILGIKGFTFDIELRLGAGAYICGEETALFEAIEGRRGFPRIKPPFPTTHGLFSQPTAINNVETLVAALRVFEKGVDTWRSAGTKDSPGTKLFCLSGHVVRPGVYEVPFGLTLRELIDMAGGVSTGHPIRAVLMGGAAGVFVGPEALDTPLTYEDSRSRKVPLGSGVVMVFDDTVDLRLPLYQLSRFFAHESCGKCFPCQLGTQRQMEILQHLSQNGGSRPGDRQALIEIGAAMTQTSLCGLGQTAASAVISAIEKWPELVE